MAETAKQAAERLNGFIDADGQPTGYDYDRRAWVRSGRYVRCGHIRLDCGCYGKVHADEWAWTNIAGDASV